jgi:hypothetical protein
MLDGLIVLVSFLLVILIGIKWGLLEILAILLSLIALVPVAASAVLYFAESPSLTFGISGKEKTRADDKSYSYDFLLAINTTKGRVVLHDLIAATDFGATPVKHPDSTVSSKYPGSLEEVRLGNAWVSRERLLDGRPATLRRADIPARTRGGRSRSGGGKLTTTV